MRTRVPGSFQGRLWFVLTTTTTLIVLGGDALAGSNQPASTSPTTSSAASASPAGPLVHVFSTGTAWFVLIVGLGVALAWLIPLAYDARRAYEREIQNRDKIVDHLISEAARSDRRLDQGELDSILRAISASPTGVKGLARTLLAFTILTVIVVITAGLLVGEDAGDLELLKQVLTTLLAALTTIVGFYYGARTAQESAAAAAPPPVERNTRQGPTPRNRPRRRSRRGSTGGASSSGAEPSTERPAGEPEPEPEEE